MGRFGIKNSFIRLKSIQKGWNFSCRMTPHQKVASQGYKDYFSVIYWYVCLITNKIQSNKRALFSPGFIRPRQPCDSTQQTYAFDWPKKYPAQRNKFDWLKTFEFMQNMSSLSVTLVAKQCFYFNCLRLKKIAIDMTFFLERHFILVSHAFYRIKTL